jgi:hypothetical protein
MARTRLSTISCRTSPEPRRAERETDRHFTAARGSTHQEEVRGVDAGEHEHEKRDGQDNGDHFSDSVASRQAGDLDPDPFHRVVRGRDEPSGIKVTSGTSDAEPPGNNGELGFGPLDADPLAQSAHVSNLARAGLLKRVVHRRTIHERDGQPEVDAFPGLSACESWRCDADDFENLPSCLDRPSDH